MELTIVASGNEGASAPELKQDDITIKDDNKKQEIVSFEKVIAGPPPAAGQPGIHNLVLIDCLNTPFSDMPENRLAILKTLDELAKTDNVTILMLREGLRVVSEPSQGAGSMLARIAGQGFSPDKTAAFNWVFSEPNALGDIFTPVPVTGRNRMDIWIKTLRVVAQNMATRNGRRNLIWISQYFPPLIMGETSAGYLEQQAGADNRSKSAAQVSNSKGRDDLSDTVRKEEADLLRNYARDIQTTGRLLENAAVAIYPIDARYLSRNTASVADKGRMQDMAKATGGLSFASPRDIAAAVHDALADTRTVYVARYAMADSLFNGKDHAIKIETRLKDVKLRALAGYFAAQQPRQ